MSDTLFISETFGPTYQGEGRNIGMPCMFLRLAGCNLACSFCDTAYAWDWHKYDVRKETRTQTWQEVLTWLTQFPVRALVITGGEPMLQQKSLAYLTRALHTLGWWTEMETAGTIAPHSTELVRQFTVSPKLTNSDNPVRKRYKPDVLNLLAQSGRAVFKFVVVDERDFDEIDPMVTTHHLSPVYIMPEGIDTPTLNTRMQALASLALTRGYHLSPRLHVQLYGNRRGV